MEGSPVWKRPAEVMKIHRRRKSVSQKKVTSPQKQRADFIYRSPSKAVKRRNPFSISENPPSKRHQASQDEEQTNSVVNLLSSLDSAEPEEIINQPEPQQCSSHLPVDWCLKTKLRVISSRPLTWCNQLKSAEEAKGLTKFLRNEITEADTLFLQKEEFQRSLMYWVHPSLPWVRLFPRIVDGSRASKSLSFLLQDDVQASLQVAWEESFTSAFHQLRSRLCPYFYLCTHQFTVLFCESRVSQSDIVAMVTPTTRGFRELLEKEGIAFTLPVGGKQQNPLTELINDAPEKKTGPPLDHSDEAARVHQDTADQDEEGDEMFETDDGASGWLESIGLDKKEFPTLDPRKVKLQREGFRVIDHRPESLIYVEGADVQALFNFLLNCRICTATSGAQAGIPPTILSPAGFKGATLKCHKVKHTVVKQPDKDGSISHAHIVEIAGPILPHNTQSLISLLHKTQHEDFGVVFNSHDVTSPFNILGRLQVEKSDTKTTHTNEQICDSDRIQQCNTARLFKHMPVSDRLCAIKNIVSTPDGFTWNT